MTKEDRVALVQGQLEAYNARDIEKFCTYFHPEITAWSLSPFEQRPSGMENFKKGYGAMFAASPNLHCKLLSRIVLDEMILDEEWVTGSAKFPNGVHATAIYAFRDGLIDRVWFAR